MDPMTQGQLKEWFVIVATFALFGWAAYLGTVIVRRKQKNDMQRALLDKFSSAHDFAEFMQSPAGQKYVMSFADAITSPVGSIVNAAKAGIVMLFSGAALLASGQRHNLWLLDTMGMLLTCAGVGFLLSAAISYFIVKKTKPAEDNLASRN
jgi:hypothetical protein